MANYKFLKFIDTKLTKKSHDKTSKSSCSACETFTIALAVTIFGSKVCIIKTHGSESRGQEETANARPSRPHGHYCE